MLFNSEALDLHKNQRNINALHAYSIYGVQSYSITKYHHSTLTLNKNKISERIKMFFSTKLCKECFHHTLFFIILYVCMVLRICF